MDEQELQQMVASLTDEETEALVVCARNGKTQNCNFHENNILRKMPGRYKQIKVRTVMRSLRRRQLVRLYRPPGNWCLTNDGFQVAYYIYRERMNALPLTIIAHGVVL